MTPSKHIHDLMTNNLPAEEDLVIDEVLRDGQPLPWMNVRVLVHQSAKKLGVKIKTRIRNGKMLVWRVVE